MKKNYRITFYDGPMGNLSKDVDVYAENSDEALHMAYRMPEAKDRRFTDVMVGKIPEGPSIIGIEFEYTDTYFNDKFKEYMFIKANNEAEAVEYYNNHFKDKHFWFNAGKTETDGKNVRGRVVKTYFACVERYDADATLENAKNISVDKLIDNATQTCEEVNEKLNVKNNQAFKDVVDFIKE